MKAPLDSRDFFFWQFTSSWGRLLNKPLQGRRNEQLEESERPITELEEVEGTLARFLRGLPLVCPVEGASLTQARHA